MQALTTTVGGFPWGIDGIDVYETSSTNIGSAGTLIEGNLIGTDATGTRALGNPNFGIGIFNDAEITVGGTAAGAANVIAGSSEGGVGIISGSGSTLSDLGSSNNLIEGNLIGINFDSNGNAIAGLGNGGSTFPVADEEAGIFLNDPADPNQTSTGNSIGGTAAGAPNIVSGNYAAGIALNGTGLTANLIDGNFIGTDALGAVAVGNLGAGIDLAGGAATTIGGVSAEARNLISGNQGDGIDVAAGVTSTLIQGNFVGVDQTGAKPLANEGDGTSIGAAAGITIGGTAQGAGNVISANLGTGLSIQGAAPGAALLGDLIGTDESGTNALGNGTYGVYIDDTAGVIVGGTVAGARNIISANADAGIGLYGGSTAPLFKAISSALIKLAPVRLGTAMGSRSTAARRITRSPAASPRLATRSPFPRRSASTSTQPPAPATRSASIQSSQTPRSVSTWAATA